MLGYFSKTVHVFKRQDLPAYNLFFHCKTKFLAQMCTEN